MERNILSYPTPINAIRYSEGIPYPPGEQPLISMTYFNGHEQSINDPSIDDPLNVTPDAPLGLFLGPRSTGIGSEQRTAEILESMNAFDGADRMPPFCSTCRSLSLIYSSCIRCAGLVHMCFLCTGNWELAHPRKECRIRQLAYGPGCPARVPVGGTLGDFLVVPSLLCRSSSSNEQLPTDRDAPPLRKLFSNNNEAIRSRYDHVSCRHCCVCGSAFSGNPTREWIFYIKYTDSNDILSAHTRWIYLMCLDCDDSSYTDYAPFMRITRRDIDVVLRESSDNNPVRAAYIYNTVKDVVQSIVTLKTLISRISQEAPFDFCDCCFNPVFHRQLLTRCCPDLQIPGCYAAICSNTECQSSHRQTHEKRTAECHECYNENEMPEILAFDKSRCCDLCDVWGRTPICERKKCLRGHLLEKHNVRFCIACNKRSAPLCGDPMVECALCGFNLCRSGDCAEKHAQLSTRCDQRCSNCAASIMLRNAEYHCMCRSVCRPSDYQVCTAEACKQAYQDRVHPVVAQCAHCKGLTRGTRDPENGQIKSPITLKKCEHCDWTWCSRECNAKSEQDGSHRLACVYGACDSCRRDIYRKNGPIPCSLCDKIACCLPCSSSHARRVHMPAPSSAAVSIDTKIEDSALDLALDTVLSMLDAEKTPNSERLAFARRHIQRLHEALACTICLEKKKNVVLEPCNHLCICSACRDEFIKMRDGRPKCPVCRCDVLNTINIFI